MKKQGISRQLFKKSRLVYFWYFLIAILLFMSIAIVPYSFSLVEQSNSNVPFLILVFVPILLYYAYQGYAMFIYGDVSVSNGIIYYCGYDKGWFPKKRAVEIPISEIQSIGIVEEEIIHNVTIELLCLKMADYNIFINTRWRN